MRNLLLILSTVLFSSYTLSRTGVGTNTVNLQGAFHVDRAKDNPATGASSIPQQANDIMVTTSKSVGIGRLPPQKKFHVNGGLPISNTLNIVGNVTNS